MKTILRKRAARGSQFIYSLTGLFLCLLLTLPPAQAQTGYLYIHAKAISEDVNQSFNFNVSKDGVAVAGFNLRDQLLNIEPTDIGAGHGTGAGELWVVTGATRGADGAIYHRAPNSAVWDKLSGQPGSSIDGADLGHFVMVTTAGDAYVYDGDNFKKIFDHGSNGVKAIDIASNGSIDASVGTTAIVDVNGHVWKYLGDYDNDRTWADITPLDLSLSKFTRVDINPTTNDILLVDAASAVTKVDADGGSLLYYGRPLLTNAAVGDVSVDDHGVIYTVAKDITGMDAVYRNDGFTGLTWKEEPQTGLHYVLTAGDASQVWVTKGYTAAQTGAFSNQSTIYTRVGDGSAVWIDDERVQTTQTDNAIMIPVEPGTYTITGDQTPGWKLQKIDVYDPASGSTVNVAGNSATIVVAPGQVAHVVFTNGMVLSNLMSAITGASIIITDFGAGAEGTKGAPLTGFTDFHFYSNALLNTTPDGYYSLAQNSLGWSNNTLTDHTGTPGGYFMMVNASYAPNVFYKQRITGLIPGNMYMLSFWTANLSPSSPLQPEILAGITDTTTGAIVGSLSTGSLTKDKIWHQYIFSFMATATSGDVFLQNNALGGFGNDLAIDDIGLSSFSSLLAINSLQFSAIKNPSTVQLKWTTTAQTFTDYEVQQSLNGNAWKTLGKVAATDSKTSTNAYTYIDQQPAAGTSYYRLLLMDKTGATSYSTVETVVYDDEQLHYAQAVYPNPFTNILQLQLQAAKTGLVTLSLVDAGGQTIYCRNLQLAAGPHTIAIDGLSRMPRGLYFLQVSKDGTTATERIIKQ